MEVEENEQPELQDQSLAYVFSDDVLIVLEEWVAKQEMKHRERKEVEEM